MYKEEELEIVHVLDLPSPKPLFDMVMTYARQSKKEEWKCFGYVFSEGKFTVAIRDIVSQEYVGYFNGQLTDDGDWFWNHAYMAHPIVGIRHLLQRICNIACDMYKVPMKKMVFESDMAGRLWQKWGFEESKMKLYEQDIRRI